MEREWPRQWRGVIDSQFQLSSVGLLSQSPYTGETTPFGPLAQRFVCKVTFPTAKAVTWRAWSGFVTSMRGVSNTIRMVDYFRMRTGFDQDELNRQRRFPQSQPWSDDTYWSDDTGWAEGFLPPLAAVDAAEAREATSLVISALPASLDRALRMGDLFEIRPNGIRADHGHLYEITHDARTNAAGKTRVTFEPGLRKGVAAGDQVVLRYPSSLFRFASADEGAINRSSGNIANMGMSLVEVLPQG